MDASVTDADARAMIAAAPLAALNVQCAVVSNPQTA
jgi:hypothetical protein